jgi:hypothetical protein
MAGISALVLTVAFGVALVAGSAATVTPDTYVLQYAVGNATVPMWRQKATLLVTEHRVRPEDATAAWTYADVRALREGHPYRLRIIAAEDVEAKKPRVFASTRLSPCTLLTAKQYANTPLKGTYERIGISLTAPIEEGPKKRRLPTGIRMLSNFVDTVCELAVFAPAIKQAQAAAGKLAPEPTAVTGLGMTVVVQSANPIAAPSPPPAMAAPRGASAEVGPDGKKAAATGADGKPEQEPDNRSFLEKYWMYIVMFLGYSVVSSLFAPAAPAEAGKGGKPGAAAAPAVRK